MPELISDPTLLSYTRLKCSGCGKDVSTPIHVIGELIVRAYIECPECIEGRADPLPPSPASEVIVEQPIVIGDRYCVFVERANVFDELTWRIEGLRRIPKGQCQIPAYLDHNGEWRELGTIGAGTLIDWPTESAARAFAEQAAQETEHE
jgi:DNA-directed RNA polymerase subunit RPC12/RpoP